MKTIQINKLDNVEVALTDDCTVAKGHKIALVDIEKGSNIIKYGCSIGYATADIKKGEHVHTHNVKTNLSENTDYSYKPQLTNIEKTTSKTFGGFVRDNGKVGIRNEIWIIPTVGCVNGVAEKLVKDNADLIKENVDGLYAFTHPFGCSQMGDDHETTKKLLASLVHHPNAAAVLVLGLGCENNTMEQFKEAVGEWNDDRVKFLVCQDVNDEFEVARNLLEELSGYANKFTREEVSADKLIIGMKCGGSDGLSGITANPVVGEFSDKMIAMGASTILTEVPEMFGAEEILFNRCKDEETYKKAVNMVENFKDYFISHNQVVYENPSPGNKAGGITTLEDKSCGCVQKGGVATVVDVIGYAERVKTKGLNLLSGPGNDLVSSTALTASGAHIILFTTGRGTPFGAPAPTVKISTNTALFEKKNNWIDFNAGEAVEGKTIAEVADDLVSYVIKLASGEAQTKTEINGYREISIFKDGVFL